MARLSKEEWNSLKADFITGAYTLSKLAKKYSVSKGAISQRAKKEQWQKMDPQETVELIELEKLNRTKQTKLKASSKTKQVPKHLLENSISELTDYQEFIHSLALSAGERIKEVLEENIVEEIVVVPGEIGDVQVADRRLNPKELKSLVDAIDKMGQTLGAVPRFSQQINIQNENKIENKTLKVEFVEAKDK